MRAPAAVSGGLRVERPARALAALLASALANPTTAQIADVRQGTDIAVALSPDGRNVVVDLLGGLWQLPATGGGATVLVPAGSGVRQPRFHPDGSSLVAQRWMGNQWDLWLFDLQTGTWRALTSTARNEREPEFSADGREVLFASDATGRFALWAVDVAGGTPRKLTDEPGDAAFPSVSDSGEIVYVNRDGAASTLRLYGGDRSGTEIYRSPHWLMAPSWRPGGHVLVVNELDGPERSALALLLLGEDPVRKELTRGEDVFAGRVAWSSPAEIVYAADGQIWRRGIGETTRTPVFLFAGVAVATGERPVVAAALDAPGPHRAAGIVGASASRDGAVTAFAALGDLWLADRREVRRLSDDAFVDAFPSVSPDGRSLVFVSDRGGNMDLWRMDLGNGVVTQLTGDAGKPFEPVIDPSGSQVAYLETEGLGRWSSTALKLLDLARPYRAQTIAASLFGARGLQWAGDAGALELHVEARRGEPQAPRDQLRFAPRPGSAARVVGAAEIPSQRAIDVRDLAPQWSPQAPEAPYVIQVGRLFDGVRSDYQRHMDIHIERQRIVAVVRRGTLPLPAKVIDAQDATVYPGLVDVHAHQSTIGGERLGRSWLVNGVTTVREITEEIGEALERAESWAAGRRHGPRLVISPAAAPDGAAELSPPPPVVLADYPALVPAFSHLLHGERERLGIPALDTRPALREIVRPNDGAVPLFRLSARNLAYQDMLATVVASGGAVGTGLAAVAGFGPPERLSRGAAAAFGRLFSPDEQRLWSDGGTQTAVIAPLQQTVASIVRGGGGVAVASDAPAVPYGYGVHAELALLAAAEIPNDQVLRLASAGGAIALGLDRQLGTIEPGKLADLVVVAGDPLARIGDAAAVTAVVRGGIWLEREALLERPSP